jgi:hypothetical protein
MTTIAFEKNMFKLDFTDERDFLVWSNPIVKDNDMRNIARKYITDNGDVIIVDGEKEDIAVRSQFEAIWGMTYIFKNLENKKYGLLLKENLLKMEAVERYVNTTKEF